MRIVQSLKMRKKIDFFSVPMKFWFVVLPILVVVALLFVITLSRMAPRITVIPQLFPKDVMRFDQFSEATHIQAKSKDANLIDEMFVRFYIENRKNYIPDLWEMAYRYGRSGPVARLSLPAVYNSYRAGIGNFQEKKEKASTVTDIVRLSRLDNTYTVDFDVYRYLGGQTSFSGRRRATLRISHMKRYRRYGKDFANPYGFVVTSYSESPLKKY